MSIFASQLDFPPIHDPFLVGSEKSQTVNPTWIKWFDSLILQIGLTLVRGRSSSLSAPAVPFPITLNFIQLPSLTTTQRDSAVNPPDGLIFYNSTIPAVQARIGGSWVNL